MDRKEKCDLHFGNLEAYENFRDELKSSLDKKMKTIETFRLSSQISDLKAIDLELKQIESIKNDLVNKDFNTYENLSRYVDLLNESIFKRDSKYLKN